MRSKKIKFQSAQEKKTFELIEKHLTDDFKESIAEVKDENKLIEAALNLAAEISVFSERRYFINFNSLIIKRSEDAIVNSQLVNALLSLKSIDITKLIQFIRFGAHSLDTIQSDLDYLFENYELDRLEGYREALNQLGIPKHLYSSTPISELKERIMEALEDIDVV